ncbi:MAG: DUF6036 family nucleotidyltransferase [bacterium]|nr:hypothetical protein [bacterium]MDT8367116.1 DUF6036 family nucleotidyltransferase [bacterium]
MHLYRNLFNTLNKQTVRYLVVGGVAVNLHGIERATGDIDLMIDLEQENVSKFLETVRELGLKPKIPVKLDEFADSYKRKAWREDKGMLVFPLYDPEHPYFLLDVMTEPPVDFDTVYGDRQEIDFGGTPVATASINTLIEMKKDTGRPQDEADVSHLQMILKSDKDE